MVERPEVHHIAAGLIHMPRRTRYHHCNLCLTRVKHWVNLTLIAEARHFDASGSTDQYWEVCNTCVEEIEPLIEAGILAEVQD